MNTYIIAKYIRLSKDDTYSNSLSISNQHLIIDNHIKTLNLSENISVASFVDNDFTGVNLDRPALQNMLNLIKTGEINCVIVKDFSRFSRNFLESAYYIEMIFPLYQIRFISVSDLFDSINHNGSTGSINISFQFLKNEYYSIDLSKKIKDSRRIQMKKGEGKSGYPIFGYQKKCKGQLEIDEKSAKIVQHIFDMALKGLSTSLIKEWLFNEKQPSPKEYQDLKFGKNIEPKCNWNVNTIRNILNNEQYIGTYVSGKIANNGFRGLKVMYAEENDWIKIPNFHPAIISKDKFFLVKKRLENIKKVRRTNKQQQNFILSGKIKCGYCRSKLSYTEKDETIFCAYGKNIGSNNCQKINISVREFEDVIFTIVQKKLDIIKDSIKCPTLDEHKSILHMEKKIKKQKQEYYEQFIYEKIDKSKYCALIDECTKQLQKINNQILLSKYVESNSNYMYNLYDEKILKKYARGFFKNIYVFSDYNLEATWNKYWYSH